MTEREYEAEGEIRETEQFESTVPKGLVEAMGWEHGDDLDWTVGSGNRLEVTKVDG